MSATEYQVLYADSLGELECLVRECLNVGWTLQGGLAVMATEDGFWAYQAVTRLKDGSEMDEDLE